MSKEEIHRWASRICECKTRTQAYQIVWALLKKAQEK